MFKIGDFSKLSEVGSKTLRYYDDIGLLKPSHVDRFTGYRYYTIEQLPRLNRIIALKELGFSLEQIARLLEDSLSAEQLQGMLRMKEAEIERSIAEEQERLLRVQARLKQIRAEGASPLYDVVLKQNDPLEVASIRDHVSDYSESSSLFDALFAALAEQEITPGGVAFVLYHDGEYREHDPEIEVCIPVSAPGEDGPRMTFRQLPAQTVATTIHTGPYAMLSSAYGALLTWIAVNGYDILPPNRELYLRGPDPQRAAQDYVTEVQFPVIKRP
jgi:DNA-binding transcriptional MerR regulator